MLASWTILSSRRPWQGRLLVSHDVDTTMRAYNPYADAGYNDAAIASSCGPAQQANAGHELLSM
jgi:hypothetical protein